jgi:hypothetical protein
MNRRDSEPDYNHLRFVLEIGSAFFMGTHGARRRWPMIDAIQGSRDASRRKRRAERPPGSGGRGRSAGRHGLLPKPGGCRPEVVGPFHTVHEALNCVRKSRIDVAVLDYALADRNSDALQCVLESREIPFVVVTAYPRVLVRRNDNQHVLSDLAQRAVRERARGVPLRQNSCGVKGLFWPAFCARRSYRDKQPLIVSGNE